MLISVNQGPKQLEPKTNRWLADPHTRKTIGLWLLLRVLTSVVALIPSVFQSRLLEYSAIERAISAWPPSTPIGAWLERLFVEPWLRWDAKYYVWAVSRGFSIADGSASFHPLTSWLAKPIYFVTGEPLFSVLLVATLAALGLYFCFHALGRLDLHDDEAAWRASLLFITYPVSYVFFVPYTESTFLLFAVLMFLFARQRQWWLAGVYGALATLTRQQGLFLLIPLGWELWKSNENRIKSLAVVSLIPMAYAGWVVYRGLALMDGRPDLSSFQGLVYSVLISPSAHKVVAEQQFLFPPYALYLALVKLLKDPNVPTAIDLLIGFSFITLTVIAWRNLRTSYKLYCLTILLVSFGYHTGMRVSSPYMGLPRHLLLAFPIFIGLAPRVSQSLMDRLFKIGLFGLLLLTFLHSIGGWVPQEYPQIT